MFDDEPNQAKAKMIRIKSAEKKRQENEMKKKSSMKDANINYDARNK